MGPSFIFCFLKKQIRCV